MNSIDTLTEIFSRFPGIGPRQAKRFVYFLLYRQGGVSDDLIKALENLKHEVSQCEKCLRYFPKNGSASKLCKICAEPSRDQSLLMIVPRDIDLESVEKSGGYKGLYFVLGGSLPILEKEPEKRIRIENLKLRITNDKGIKEVILAMNANAEGENTADFLREQLHKYIGEGYVISILGRGLSTGAELEYADPETLKNALLHRTK